MDCTRILLEMTTFGPIIDPSAICTNELSLISYTPTIQGKNLTSDSSPLSINSSLFLYTLPQSKTILDI